MKRRTFLGWLAAAPAAFVTACRACNREDAAATVAAPMEPTPPQLTTLSDDEAATLSVVLERLIPSTTTPTSPGATETRVLYYMDRQLGESHFLSLRQLVGKGVVYLDAISRRLHHKRFRELRATDQDAILTEFQAGRVPGLRFPQARFFEVVHALALEGFLGDPSHGGNHQSLAWKWIGVSTACGHFSGA